MFTEPPGSRRSLVGPVGIEPTTCGLKGSVSLLFVRDSPSPRPRLVLDEPYR